MRPLMLDALWVHKAGWICLLLYFILFSHCDRYLRETKGPRFLWAPSFRRFGPWSLNLLLWAWGRASWWDALMVRQSCRHSRWTVSRLEREGLTQGMSLECTPVVTYILQPTPLLYFSYEVINRLIPSILMMQSKTKVASLWSSSSNRWEPSVHHMHPLVNTS